MDQIPVGHPVRYRPGMGTYGYEDETRRSSDGRVAGVVIGHTPRRVRVRLSLCFGRTVDRSVDEDSLIVVARSTS